jgi:hypothetical protein
MGKMEILMSPGFINYGIVSTKGDEVANLLRNKIMIGVSSRGVGSLVEGRNGEHIVQDDFAVLQPKNNLGKIQNMMLLLRQKIILLHVLFIKNICLFLENWLIYSIIH